MPYPEWRRWHTYSLLKPFGFNSIEMAVARILAMIYNANSKYPKRVDDFLRTQDKMLSDLIDGLQNRRKENLLENLSPEERKKVIRDAVRKDFGIKNDNSGNHKRKTRPRPK